MEDGNSSKSFPSKSYGTSSNSRPVRRSTADEMLPALDGRLCEGSKECVNRVNRLRAMVVTIRHRHTSSISPQNIFI